MVITGEVLYPGPYALERRGETVSSLLARAGGLTAEAYAEGASLIRDGLPLGLNLVQVLDQSRRGVDLRLQPGDSLEVPEYDGTVRIIGAVEFQSRTRWRRRWNRGCYLDQAGGTGGVAATAALALTYRAALARVTGFLITLPLEFKLPLALAAIAPLAFCMGMPFPLGLARVGREVPELVPWAWGINGCASVISAVLAALLAIEFGFSAVVALAVALYLLAAAVWRGPLVRSLA